MQRLALVSAAALALASCNNEPSVSLTNATAEEVAAKAGEAGLGGTAMSPGRWEAKVSIAGIEMPGVPPAMADQMKAKMGEGRVFASCLTPEQARQPGGDFFKGEKSPDCRYDKFEMGSGAIDAVMTCSIAGGTQTTSMKGSYSEDSYRMSLESSGTGEGGPMAGGKIAMTVEAQRTGECRGDEL